MPWLTLAFESTVADKLRVDYKSVRNACVGLGGRCTADFGGGAIHVWSLFLRGPCAISKEGGRYRGAGCAPFERVLPLAKIFFAPI